MAPRQTLLGVIVSTLILGCPQPDLSGTGTVPSGQGQLSVSLTGTSSAAQANKPSAPPGRGSPAAVEAQEIHVVVVKVTAHSTESGWTTVSDNTVAVDLLKLANSAQDLGLVNLPAGTVTQIRLYTAPTGNYIVLPNGTRTDLKVPSGAQSGIKIIGPFDIHGCARDTVQLACDGPRSIEYHATGNGSEYILRPVIRADKTLESSLTCTGHPDAGGVTDAGTTVVDAGTPPPPPPPPPPSGPGTSCSAPSDCLSGDCQSTCQPGAPGTPCTAATDCASQVCQSDGTCGGPGGSPGTPCTANSQCLSGSCSAGSCQPGGPGTPCSTDNDCDSALGCIAGSCSVTLN